MYAEKNLELSGVRKGGGGWGWGAVPKWAGEGE